MYWINDFERGINVALKRINQKNYLERLKNHLNKIL